MTDVRVLALPDFLLARYADEEEMVTRLGSNGRRAWAHYAHAVSVQHERAGWLVLRFSPARILADLEAKRRIVARHRDCDETAFGDPCPDLVALAQPYVDDPECRDEWKL